MYNPALDVNKGIKEKKCNAYAFLFDK